MHPSDDPAREPSDQAVIVDAEELPALFDALRGRGYTVVGPTVRDGAIVVAELASAAELPFGWGVETEAGRYRLRERSDTAAFGHSAGRAVMEERAASGASEAVVRRSGDRHHGSRRGGGATQIRPARGASV